ncbi:hypothetical protein ACFU6R_03115 [Streptomyces sp. NPDC057499]|uniref:hypothetical protein n=1 Tax=Streptomyces sp. NPDC057499 TaxID=3346150 RepID=UPI003689CF8B
MKIEREAYEIETEAGSFYITVVSAEHDTVYDHKNEQVEQITPRVWISTDREFKGEPELGSVKIRGRKYSTEYTYKRLPDDEGRLSLHGIVMKWTTDSKTWNRGRRNDKGRQLDYDAKAYGTLRHLEVEALNRFESEHPTWKTESFRRLFEYERDAHASQAATLRGEAEEKDATAAKWQARLDELAG